MNKRIEMLKKWLTIYRKENILSVDQVKGKSFSLEEISGYYNDMTGKVLNECQKDENGIPLNTKSNGDIVYFPIAIAQYGLGNYDLFLQTNDQKYWLSFINCCDWLIKDQDDETGGWDCFGRIGQRDCHKYSAMAQGESTSLMIRAFIHTKDNKYLNSAIKAIELMLKPIEDGGTTRYVNEKIYFEEYVKEKKDAVLNGWCFAIFGLYDFCKLTNNQEYIDILKRTLKTLSNEMGNYDNKYWSTYNQNAIIASPFYHDLHIALLDVMYELFKDDTFKRYKEKFVLYKNHPFKRKYAILQKIKQKLINPGQVVIIK